MKPVTPFDNYPSFGNAGARQAPGDAKYALGFIPADTFPAEWANYFFHGATKGVSDLNSAVTSLWNEMASVLSNYNITPDATDNDQLLECLTKLKSEAALAAHPVGSLYWTSSSDNPATTFGGGTWVQIKDKFILAAGDTYTNGGTGGSATVTLTLDQMPSHSHSTITQSTTTTGIESQAHDHAYDYSVTKLTLSTSGGGVATVGLGDYILGEREDVRSSNTGTENTTHTHDYSHTHTTDSKGSGQAHNNMPPYIVKFCWERTA